MDREERERWERDIVSAAYNSSQEVGRRLLERLDACERERDTWRTVWVTLFGSDAPDAAGKCVAEWAKTNRDLKGDARALAQALTPFAKQEAADTHEGAEARRALARPGVRRLLEEKGPVV